MLFVDIEDMHLISLYHCLTESLKDLGHEI